MKDPVEAWQEVVRTCENQTKSSSEFKRLWQQAAADAQKLVEGFKRLRGLRAQFRMTENAREIQLRSGVDGFDRLLQLTDGFESLLLQVESLERSLLEWEAAACRSWQVVREAEKRLKEQKPCSFLRVVK